jgi:hypothetical protein
MISKVLDTMLGLGETKIDPDVLITVMTFFGIVQGGLLMFALGVSLKMYGSEDESLYSRVHAEYIGAAVLTCGLACFCLFRLNLDMMTTFTWASLIWTAEHIRALINQYPSKIGMKPQGQVFWLLYSILVVHACFFSASYARQLILAGHSLFAVHNVLIIIKPKLAGRIYGYKKLLNDDQKDWLRGFAYENLAMSTLVLSLVNGAEAHKAVGLTSMVVVVHCAHDLLIGCELGMLGSFLMYFWMICHATTAVTFVSAEVVANVMRGVIAIVTVAKFTRVVIPLMEAYPQIGEEDLLTKAPGL